MGWRWGGGRKKGCLELADIYKKLPQFCHKIKKRNRNRRLQVLEAGIQGAPEIKVVG